MKKFLSVLLAAAVSVTLLCGCNANAPEQTSAVTEAVTENVSAVSGGFKVDGTKLLDANGNEFVLRGINHSHAWFKDQDETAIKAIAETGANCVRIVLACGIKWSRDSRPDVTRLIDMCRENNLIAIVEVHDGTGDDSPETLDKIADYWIKIKDALIGNEAYVILNIANEWTGNWDSDNWGTAYASAIPKIREAGIENTIMVDAAGWGQYGKSIQDKGAEVFSSDPLGNTMFSVHMYGTAGKNSTTIEENITGATDRGLCICVGEFGYKHSDGDVDEAYIMKYCTENNIGYLGWSWKGNGGGVEYLDLAEEWDGSKLSADWGEVLINGENGIRSTSKPCSVFE